MPTHKSSEYIRLKELGNSKFEVAKNESDIRGWTVKNGRGRILGKVSDLLFDIESEKVLYMVLDLDGNEMHLRDRKVLAPLNVAEINEVYQNVIYHGTMANELTELPTYEKGKVSTRIEDMVLHAFSSSDTSHRELNSDSSSFTENPAHAVRTPFHADAQQVNTKSADRARPQTVIGVFEHSNQGQTAIEYLLGNGFNRSQIEITSRETQFDNNADDNGTGGLTDWFKSVFGNDHDARTYSDAARTGCVVSVHTSTVDESEAVAEILDKHGAIDVNDSSSSRGSNYRSRILDARDGNSKWT